MARTRPEAEFWGIVQGLRWRLTDSMDPFPQEGEFFEGGRRRAWPNWATHAIAFLLGGLALGALLVARPVTPLIALALIVFGVTFVARKR